MNCLSMARAVRFGARVRLRHSNEESQKGEKSVRRTRYRRRSYRLVLSSALSTLSALSAVLLWVPSSQAEPESGIHVIDFGRRGDIGRRSPPPDVGPMNPPPNVNSGGQPGY